MIGDVLLECELEPGVRRTLAGFENHAGRTLLDEGAEPLGRVVAGFGNDGETRLRGLPGRATRSARTCTGRCCRGTRGSPTGCWRGRWRTPGERPGWSRCPMSSSARRTPSRPTERGRAAAASRAPRAARGRRSGRRAASAEEALDRRVQHDVVELVDSRRAGGRERQRPARSPLQRPAGQVGREDDVHDVLRAKLPAGAIESTIATGPSTGGSSSMPTSSASSRCSARRGSRPSRRRRRAAASTRGPASRAGRAACSPASAGSPRRGCAARPSSLRAKSRSRGRRARSRQLIDLDGLELRDRRRRRAARSACPARRRTSRAVGVQQDDLHLAAVAGVDEAGRVHDRDPVLAARPDRGWTKPA